MNTSPHYLLFSEASCTAPTGTSWRFVLQDVETNQRMVVSDQEPVSCGERLELLAVVRGLEALDGPARVTLVTRSRYVTRGMKHGLAEWRANDWRWERFGRIVPVKDCDLWQRVDRALLFHQVDCQPWQFPESAEDSKEATVGERTASLETEVSVEKQPVGVAALAGRPRQSHSPTLRWMRRKDRLPSQRSTPRWQSALLARALPWKAAIKGWGAPPVAQGAA